MEQPAAGLPSQPAPTAEPAPPAAAELPAEQPYEPATGASAGRSAAKPRSLRQASLFDYGRR